MKLSNKNEGFTGISSEAQALCLCFLGINFVFKGRIDCRQGENVRLVSYQKKILFSRVSKRVAMFC